MAAHEGATRWGIGIDIGGTSAKIAVVSEHGEILTQENVPTLSDPDPLRILAPFAVAVDRLRTGASAQGVRILALGCGVPGYLDPTRTHLDLSNVAGLDGFALAPWLRERFGLPISLDNDACMAAVAETRLAPAGVRRVVCATVGTGVGVVLVVDGVVVRVMHGVTGDGGHVLVDAGGADRCVVGCRGCLESVAAAPAIAETGRRAARAGGSPALASTLARRGELTAGDVAAAATQGDAAAQTIIRRAGYWLGLGVASWAAVYEPELVLLGGGVSGAGQVWLEAVMAALHERGMPYLVERMAVRRATLGDRAGVIGAAIVALADVTLAASL